VAPSNSFQFHLCNIYRPPSYLATKFIEEFTLLLEYFTSLSRPLALCGDFNWPSRLGNQLHLLITSFGLQQIVNQSTRLEETLDLLIVSDDFPAFSNVDTHDTDYSDHNIVLASFDLPYMAPQEKILHSYLDFHSADLDMLSTDLTTSLQNCDNLSSPDAYLEEFTSVVSSSITQIDCATPYSKASTSSVTKLLALSGSYCC
jgi:hypothetical protein